MFAKPRYETVVLKPDYNLSSIQKSSGKRYVVGYDFDLNGKEVVIGAYSILVFDGGSLSNGKLRGTETIIEAGLEEILKNIENTGSFQCEAVYPQWFGAKADGKHDCSDAKQQAINFAINGNVVGNPWDIQQVEGYCLKVVASAGSYILSKPIYIRSYTHLEGQGRGITKFVNGGINDGRALIYFGNEGGGRNKVHNASVSNFSINGNDKNCLGVYSLAQYSFIDNLFVTKCKGYGIYSYESWCTYIKNCYFIYNAIDTEGYTVYLIGKSSGRGAMLLPFLNVSLLDKKFLMI